MLRKVERGTPEQQKMAAITIGVGLTASLGALIIPAEILVPAVTITTEIDNLTSDTPGPSGLGRGAKVGSMIDPKGTTTASSIIKESQEVGFTASQTANGPLKMVDENGGARATIKGGSARAPGSAGPHVELKDSNGQRVNPAGQPVTRKSPENHTPIIDDRDQ